MGKPIHRVHTAGSVGASTAISAATLVESGMYDTVLTLAYEKQSEGDFMWALSGGRSGGAGRRRLLRSVDPRLHQEEWRTGAHRLEGRRQGSLERAQEPLRSPADE